MFGNYLIGLREGLEAALVVSILIAYAVRTDRRHLVGWIWAGAGLAVALSLGIGAALTLGSGSMSFQAQEAFGGFMSIFAVGLVTWMVFWMAGNARNLRGELHGAVDRAVEAGIGAVVLVAFVSVVREGIETAVFLWSAVQASGSGAAPLSGALLGLATAVLIGWLFYRGALKLNLAVFFRWTGAALILVAAGVLSYGIHDLQEAGILPGLDNLAFDVSAAIPPDSWYGTLLKGTLNFTPATTWLQAIAWVAYVVPVMVIFWRKTSPAPRAAAPSAAMAPSAVTAGGAQ